jgi:mannosyltransferase OCH1-like enzyme
MIPRKIHYCWLGDNEIPPNLKECQATWTKVLPDYEVVKWDESSFDIESSVFVSEACRMKKWAFASDYIRIHALYTEGGMYLDTDVEVRKRFDEFLGYGIFTSVEYHPDEVRQHDTLSLLNPDGSSKQPFTRKPGIGLQAAVIAGVKGHPFLRDCLEYYRDRHFLLPDGSHYDTIISPDIYAMVAEKYGFRYQDERQVIGEDILILPSEIFAGNREEATSNSYAVHYCVGSWRNRPQPGALRRALNAGIGMVLRNRRK